MGLPKTPSVVAERVLFDPMWRVLLICRGNEPFRGEYALPAGFVEIGETVEEACCREVKEETGVEIARTGFRTGAVKSSPLMVRRLSHTPRRH